MPKTVSADAFACRYPPVIPGAQSRALPAPVRTPRVLASLPRDGRLFDSRKGGRRDASAALAIQMKMKRFLVFGGHVVGTPQIPDTTS